MIVLDLLPADTVRFSPAGLVLTDKFVFSKVWDKGLGL
jgi:hypothetical protein